jgi:hypothetical protein
MPISDPEGYSAGHFRRVFEDIIVPGCEAAGYAAIRADEVRATDLIHLDVLQRLLNAPVALCDLSSRNPNVLFELGLRQAFDKPVVLVQESGTQQIFDIAPLRYTEYRRARLYNEVLEDQKKIAAAITATVDAHEENAGVNSLVKILELTKPASLSDVEAADSDPGLQIIRAEVNELRLEVRRFMHRVGETRAAESFALTFANGNPSRLPFSGLQARILSFMLKHPGWIRPSAVAQGVRMSETAVLRALTKMQNRGMVSVGLSDGESAYRLTALDSETPEVAPVSNEHKELTNG